MKGLGVILAVALTWLASAQSAPAAPAAQGADPPGLHDFDFLVGEWRVHHQIKRAPDQSWVKFDGTCSHRSLMAGWAYDAGKTWDTNWIMDFQRIS